MTQMSNFEKARTLITSLLYEASITTEEAYLLSNAVDENSKELKALREYFDASENLISVIGAEWASVEDENKAELRFELAGVEANKVR